MTQPSPDAASAPYESMSYEQLVDALERLTKRMADGHTGIEEAAELYEQARHLEAVARERLERVQRRIDALAEEEEGPAGPSATRPGMAEAPVAPPAGRPPAPDPQ